ncbi:MAG: hypothetical protein KAZ71_01960 [Bacteroidia bacterium]|nr:hypothetical protein [Bacteroidia bacterium]
MKLFKSVILTGLFFGIISGLLVVACIIVPVHRELKDIFILMIVVAAIIASQTCIDITNSKEAFYPLFFTSCIAFLCFPFSFWLYFKFIKIPIEGQWLMLLSLGVISCFITSVFTAHFRSKKHK